MKYIILGLGSFGSSLAQKLTIQGNEVIGIDSNYAKIESLKDTITHVICLDATDEITVSGLPLKDTDVVVVAIGENQGANIMVTALMKNLNVKRLVSRAINPLHEKVLEALGVDEIVHPEEETAERWSKKLCLKQVLDSFELNSEYSIIEAKVPEEYVQKTIREVGFKRTYGLLVLTIIKKQEIKSLVGKTKIEDKILGVAAADEKLEENDVLVLFGTNKDLQKFLRISNL